MDIKEFIYLIKIADTGSVTKAANQLFITQPALSKFIRNKEEEMGTRLFSRVGKRFVPTYAGEKCIEAARRVLAINKQLEDEMAGIVKQGKGRIRLAFHSSWSDFFFRSVYPAYQEKYPDIDLQIFEANSSKALEMMDKGELDIAVVATTWRAHSKFVCETLRSQRFVLAVRDGHPLLEKTEVRQGSLYPHLDLRALQDVPLILRHANQQTRSYTAELLQNVDIKPRVALETQSRENALRAVEYGIGVTFTLDDPALLLTHESIRLISFDDPNPDSYINIVYIKGLAFSNSEHELMQMIAEQHRLLPSQTIA